MSNPPPRMTKEELKERYSAMHDHYSGDDKNEPAGRLVCAVADLILQAYHYVVEKDKDGDNESPTNIVSSE